MSLRGLGRYRLPLIAVAVAALVAGVAAAAIGLRGAAPPGHGGHRVAAAAGSGGASGSDAASPTASGSPSGSSSPSPSARSSPGGRSTSAAGLLAATGAAAARGGSGARLRQVDGGAGYYARFSPSLPTDPSFFPVGVWYESVVSQSDIDKDKDAGLNTYVQLTDSTRMNLIADAGMYAIHSDPRRAGRQTVAWELPDEADMWAGPGWDGWTGNYAGEGTICSTSRTTCGYTVDKTILDGYPADKRMRYSNYGKGVSFWDSDDQAATFVNQFTDIVSVDNYWLTDENICIKGEGGGLFDPKLLLPGENGGSPRLPDALCHRPANYGLTIDRVRSLVSPAGSEPVWAFVEVGHPWKDSESPLTAQPRQIAAAVWSSLIHGARGIIYFNHSFGGPCQTQHALREPCYAPQRAAVKQVDGQIEALAPVLNAPFADGVVTAGAGVDVAAKWYDGHFYLLAESTSTSAVTGSFSLPCVGDATATVLDENRTVKATGGRFADRFADDATVHLYRIDGGSSCGAY